MIPVFPAVEMYTCASAHAARCRSWSAAVSTTLVQTMALPWSWLYSL